MWQRLRSEGLIAASAALAVPAALSAHPHEGSGGLAHGLLHAFLGAGHLLPALAATLAAAGIGGGTFLALRRLRRPARRRQEARERV